jgi:hypothetical protein
LKSSRSSCGACASAAEDGEAEAAINVETRRRKRGRLVPTAAADAMDDGAGEWWRTESRSWD